MMFFIVGPTAAGKSAVAAEVAARLGAEIVSADAFQIYRGLDLLTAKPDPALLAKARHHLIGELPIEGAFDVAQYRTWALSRIAEIEARGRPPLIVGGTGLYVRALTHGLSDLPAANQELRAELDALPLAELQQRLSEHDPASAGFIDMKNKRRLVRALEVCLLTGRPFSSFRAQWTHVPSKAAGVLLERDRDDLYERIERRVLHMFKQGVLREVAETPEPGATAAQAIGLHEIRAVLRGEISEAEAIVRIQQATRRYAKRQLTWFRRDPMFEPLNLTTSPPESAIALIVQKARALAA